MGQSPTALLPGFDCFKIFLKPQKTHLVYLVNINRIVFADPNTTFYNPRFCLGNWTMFFNSNDFTNFVFIVFIVCLVFFILLYELTLQWMTETTFNFDNDSFVICCTFHSSLQYTSWHNFYPFMFFSAFDFTLKKPKVKDFSYFAAFNLVFTRAISRRVLRKTCVFGN